MNLLNVFCCTSTVIVPGSVAAGTGTTVTSVKMADTPYTVPIIASDLRHEEMIQQMCDMLVYLDQVASDIFSRISQRVTENREKLAQLNSRIAVAEAKVNHIKGWFFLATSMALPPMLVYNYC